MNHRATVPVPEGRRRRLAGGKSAPADAAPGNGAENRGAPAGPRRKGPGREPITAAAICSRRRVVAELPLPGNSSMPRWGMVRSAAHPGAAPAARACPRLISCGVPPGRGAEASRQYFVRQTAARPAAKSSRHPRILLSCSAERKANWPDQIGSPTDHFSERTPALVFLCVHRVSVVPPAFLRMMVAGF